MRLQFRALERVAKNLGFQLVDFGTGPHGQIKGYGLTHPGERGLGPHISLKNMEEVAVALKGISAGRWAEADRAEEQGNQSIKDSSRAIMDINNMLKDKK